MWTHSYLFPYNIQKKKKTEKKNYGAFKNFEFPYNVLVVPYFVSFVFKLYET